MLKGDVNTFIGDFGLYQLRVFVAIFVLGMFSMDSIHVVFIGANMPHWCRVAELDDLPYDVQKNVAIPIQSTDGSIEHSSCEMFSLNYSVYNRSEFYRWNRSLMITNETSITQCSQWTYDHSQFISTIVSKVKKIRLVIDATVLLLKKVKAVYSVHGKPISELRSVTCHMGLGSHSVTCHPTQVNALRLNPSQTGRYSIYLPRRDERLSWPR